MLTPGEHGTAPSSGARSQAMKDRIAEVALRLLCEGGLKKLGQTQVAKAAGMPQGHLTYYFPRKHDLVIAMARKALAFIGRTFAEAAPPGSGTSLEARTAATERLAAVVCNRERTRLMLGLIVESDENEELRAMLAKSVEEMRRLAGQAMGLAPESPDVALGVSAIWGLSVQAFLQPDHADHEACRRAVTRHLDRFSERFVRR